MNDPKSRRVAVVTGGAGGLLDVTPESCAH